MSSRNPVTTTAIACSAVALGALVMALALGHPRAGIALGAGLLVGSVNGHFAERALRSPISFRATSLARMALLSVAGLAIGLLLGMDVAWLPLIGIAAAQLVLAVVAARLVWTGRGRYSR